MKDGACGVGVGVGGCGGVGLSLTHLGEKVKQIKERKAADSNNQRERAPDYQPQVQAQRPTRGRPGTCPHHTQTKHPLKEEDEL